MWHADGFVQPERHSSPGGSPDTTVCMAAATPDHQPANWKSACARHNELRAVYCHCSCVVILPNQLVGMGPARRAGHELDYHGAAAAATAKPEGLCA